MTCSLYKKIVEETEKEMKTAHWVQTKAVSVESCFWPFMNTKGRVCRTTSTYDCRPDCDFELSILSLAIRLKITTKKMHTRYLCYTGNFRGAHNGQGQIQCAKYFRCAPTLVMVFIISIFSISIKILYVGFVSNKYWFILRLCYLCITITEFFFCFQYKLYAFQN
jgi:hypothetical protein